MKYQQCPVHDEVTVFDYHIYPDQDWQWRATALQMGLKGKATADDDGIITLDIAITTNAEGLLFISSHDVILAGVQHRFPSDEVLAIGPSLAQAGDEPDDNLYEVIAYVEADRAYWIKPLRVPSHVPAE
ncbi:MAG: hypothetical protein LC118_16415 [Dehalococcoidia bacterium]|nr:hypothetical protein [Dehalococcoidia bacterium]